MKTLFGILILCAGLALLTVIPYWIGRIIKFKHDNNYYRATHLQSLDFKFKKWIHGMIIIIILLTSYYLGGLFGNHIF